MDFDYFYGRDSESFRFIRLPSVLLEDELFIDLSIDARYCIHFIYPGALFPIRMNG